MNSLASTAHHRNLGPTKPTTKAKKRPNRPPVKVVYISNPMRVTTSASRFMALVQRLTGRDSRFPDDPTAYEVEGCSGDVTGNVSVGGPVGGDDDVVVEAGNKSAGGSSSATTTTTSSCEEMGGYDGADEFLMVGDFPDLGSEGLLWTLIS